MGAGATINETTRFANITMADSDDPQGVVYFAVGHRLPIATLMTERLSLQVYRKASTSSAMSVQYRTLVSNKQILYVIIKYTAQLEHAGTHEFN